MASQATHPELRLLFACARLQADLAQVRECAAAHLDWNKAAAAAEYHGTLPLLLNSLKLANAPVPDDALRKMEHSAAVTVRQNLFLTSEMLRVTGALNESGIRAVPMKGAVLAQSLYGDLGLRPFSDTDLLVRREEIEAAESVVMTFGYKPEVSIPAEHRERWLKHQCELTFRRGEMSRLELHWDIAHPHFTLQTGVEGFWSRLATTKIGDASVPKLSDPDLLFTLIVHGSRHAWSRLMWLVDVAELLRMQPQIDWKEFIRNAEQRGAARLVATALMLGRSLFDVFVSDGALQAAYSDGAAAALADRVLRHWDDAMERDDLSDLEPSPMWRHRWIMRARERRVQRWNYAYRVLTMVGDEEFEAAQLPRNFSSLYTPLRIWNVFRKTRPKSMAAPSQSKH
jgi:putative nucleotidyltransferase-like protein